MKNWNQKILFRPKVAVGVLFSAVISTLIFQNCSQGMLQDSGSASAASVAQTPSTTVGVVTMRQVYNSLMSVTKTPTGLSTISAVNLGNLSASVSLTGDPSTINGPMWMSITSLSGLACIDVLTNEANLVKNGQSSNFFVQVNLWAPAPMIQPSQIQDTINRMARSFWGRLPTSNESATILAAMAASFADVQTPANPPVTTVGNPATAAVDPNTSEMMYFLCTAMLSSMSTHTRMASGSGN